MRRMWGLRGWLRYKGGRLGEAMEVLAVDALGACEARCSELDDVTQERWKSLKIRDVRDR